MIFVGTFLLHAPLLQLPYFWDEAGYYVPAARDILLNGSLIPHTTPSNAHPPLVMAWVALWWKVAGYAPAVTRSAMLVVAAFSLLGIFRLGQRVANTEVAVGATALTALYPVFFAQSSLLHVDLAAAGLTLWGLTAYLEDRPLTMASWFALAVLAKETAILAPLALAGWEMLRRVLQNHAGTAARGCPVEQSSAAGSNGEAPSSALPVRMAALLAPTVLLGLWYAYHYARKGYVFGNPEFFRYNVAATLSPLRFVLALLLRLWQALGYLHLWLLTGAMVFAVRLAPVSDGGIERRRIAIPVQIVFLVIVAAYITALALIGGAVLARYMLTVIPLVIVVAVSTLRRRLRSWLYAVAVIGLAFIAAWFWNPAYGFSPEDNLAYRDFIVLHQDAERFLEARYPMARVLTAWPASGELTSPWLGYITRPMKVMQIENFSVDEVLSAAEVRDKYEVALVFSTKYDPPHPLLQRWSWWQEMKRRYFDYHVDLPPEAVARILGGKIVYAQEKQGEWVAVIEMERNEIQEAEVVNGSTDRSKSNAWVLRRARARLRMTNGQILFPHQVAGVSFDHQPHFTPRRELQRIAGG